MRGDIIAGRDGEINPDLVAGVPDSGIAHAIGYANRPAFFARPFIKYTPTPASFLYAYSAESEKPDRKNETDSCAQTDQG